MVAGLARYHERTRTHGVNRLVYWSFRAVVQPFLHIYFRILRQGKANVPSRGAVVFVANHRSFLDPFVIGMLTFRPVYFVAKRELFERNRLQAWFLSAMGAFPLDRGNSDEQMLETARAVLERGDAIVIFPEGTRSRSGPLREPRRGAGRLALQAGASIVPVTVFGTEHVRRGWRILPKKVSIRAGRPIVVPHVGDPTPRLSEAVLARAWPCVELMWEWFGGEPPGERGEIVHFEPKKRTERRRTRELELELSKSG